MNAMIVVKTKNGYAVAPHEGDLPPNFVSDMQIATALKNNYSHRINVADIMEEFFEPAEPVQLKEAA
jgi:hypothetical protein